MLDSDNDVFEFFLLFCALAHFALSVRFCSLKSTLVYFDNYILLFSQYSVLALGLSFKGSAFLSSNSLDEQSCPKTPAWVIQKDLYIKVTENCTLLLFRNITADFSIICCKLEWTFPSIFLCKEELSLALALTSQ